jgi:hypothetical protein
MDGRRSSIGDVVCKDVFCRAAPYEALQDNPHKYIWRERASRYTDDRQALSRLRERDLRSFENFLDRSDVCLRGATS